MKQTFRLSFPTDKGDISLPVKLVKSFNEGSKSFKTGCQGRPLSWLKVLPKIDVDRVVDSKDIEKTSERHRKKSKTYQINTKKKSKRMTKTTCHKHIPRS